ncbi:MAG: ribonuclease R [Lachnospiraceae bacterium]|nr:ribonuclease R [Lachnospiraceae bacterium]
MFQEEKKEMIAALICDEKLKPMKFRELAGFLGIPKQERGELSEILDALLKEDRIAVDSEGRYVNDRALHVTGEFFATGRGFGFVRPEGRGADADIYIAEEKTLEAMHGDTVQVTVIKQADPDPDRHMRAEGEIVKIITRANETVVGTFFRDGSIAFVRPDNRKLDFDIFVSKEHTKGAQEGQKVVCRIKHFGTKKRNPDGIVTEILGSLGDPGIDVLSVIRSYGIPTDFPQEVLAETAGVPQKADPGEVSKRLDLRDIPTVTIDGEDAKDLDDAITIEEHDGTFTLGVHIADVSHYVTEGSALDDEAQNRGTSVYFADRVIPMLPRELSNGICSLNEGEDRLALSCIMEVNGKGQVTDHKIAETVIRVNRRMSYTAVNGILTKKDPELIREYKELVPMFETMAKLSAIIRGKREDRGAIDFDLPECKITFAPNGDVEDIVPYERNVATRLIEDFMLLANETVAEHFYWLELPFVYRNHEAPDPEKMLRLNIFLSNFGYRIHQNGDTVHTKEVQKLLDKVAGTPEEAVISRLTLRSMKQAKYEPSCMGHFGLAARYYCHFTSPIRRYPDLQIHRIIKEYLHGEMSRSRIAYYDSVLAGRASRSSICERRADEAEREVEKRKKAEYMHRFLGEEYDGVISGVTNWGVYVELPNTVEGMIRMTELRDDFYRYEESQARLVGERSGRIYALGQRMRVQVAAVDLYAAAIDFVPVLK